MEIKNIFRRKNENTEKGEITLTLGQTTIPGVTDVIEIKGVDGIVTSIREWTVRAQWAAEIATYHIAKDAKMPEVAYNIRKMGFTEVDFDKEKYGIL